MRELRQILSEGERKSSSNVEQCFDNAARVPKDSRDWAYIRLCFAFGREEPGCNGGKDDNHETDDDAPARLKGSGQRRYVWR